jgi:ribosome-associated toxin RatA of RatAB toxin-antitoxin module
MADLEGTYTAVLPVTPKTACEAVLDVGDYPTWWSRSLTSSLAKGEKGKAKVGSIISSKLDKVTFEYEVRKIEPGKRIDMECTGGSYRGTAVWTFAPEKKGTKVTYKIELDAAGFVVKALGKAIDVGKIHEKVVTSSLARLAEKLSA